MPRQEMFLVAFRRVGLPVFGELEAAVLQPILPQWPRTVHLPWVDGGNDVEAIATLKRGGWDFRVAFGPFSEKMAARVAAKHLGRVRLVEWPYPITTKRVMGQ